MLQQLHQRFLRPILSAHDSPEAVAGGVSIGLSVGLTPILGIQMPIAWLLATLCGANRMVSVALVWVSNPFTVAPLYYGEYLLGCRLLRRSTVTGYHEFRALWDSMSGLSYLDRILALSDALLLPLVVGAVTPAVLLGALAYPVCLWAVRRHRSRQRHRVEEAAAAVEAATPPAARRSDGGRRVVGLVLFLAAPWSAGCLDGRGPVVQSGVPEEAIPQGVRVVWAAQKDGLRLLLAPVQAAASQEGFTQARLREMAQVEGPLHFRALHVFHAGDAGAVELEGGAVRLEVTAFGGRFDSLPPSVLLEETAPQDRPLLASLIGAEGVPPIAPGQAVRVLVALPLADSQRQLEEVVVVLGERRLPLRRGVVDAPELEEVLAEPSRDGLDRLLAWGEENGVR